MPETAEMQDTTTQATTSQQTGNPPTAGAGGGQVQSPTGGAAATAGTAGTAGAGMTPQPSGPGRSSAMSRRDPLDFGNPFAMMRAFSDQMDRLFETFGFGGSSRPSMPGSGLESRRGGALSESFWSPQIEVSRRGNDLVVCADLPGMKREDLHVEIREDHLVLHGERRQEHESEEGGFYRSERSYGRFHRTIPLPEGVDTDQAQASFRDGVLEIRMPLPQRQEPRARRIEIR